MRVASALTIEQYYLHPSEPEASVPACWILDAEEQRGWVLNTGGVQEILPGGMLEAGPFSLPFRDVFPNV